MPIIITPGAGIAEELEQLELDGLPLNSSTFWMESLSMPVPASLAEWIRGADSNGALLARSPLHENRVIEARIRVASQATHNAVVVHIGSVLDKLQEAGRNANGLPLVWDPANSTVDPITFRCLMGEITDLPIDWQDSGRFVNAWAFTVRLTCLPFGHGTEYQVATVTSSAPIIPLELANIDGDVPALGRLVVTDAASQSRRYVAWGLESRWYNDTTSLIVDSSSMVTAGYAGTTGSSAEYYGGSYIFAYLRPQTQAVCGLGNLSHVGQYRVQLRAHVVGASSTGIRLTYQAADGPMRSLPYRVPAVEGWNHIDLGLITIPEVTLGAQRWTGRIEAYNTVATLFGVFIDAIWLVPAEQYGRARATYTYRPGAMTGYDEFAGMVAGTALNGRVAPAGGTWATSGGATDYVAADGPAPLEETMARTTAADASGRYAILGSTNYTAVEVGMRRFRSGEVLAGTVGWSPIARYVDSSNYLYAALEEVQPAGTTLFALILRVAGVDTVLTSVSRPIVSNLWYGMRLVCHATGVATAQLLGADGAVLKEITASSSVLAPSGTLATGKVGLADYNSGGACGRYYDNFYVASPGSEPIACYSGQSIEFRHDSTLREDSTGTYAGAPPEYVGSRFTVPNAGGPGRKARVAVIARRNDVETSGDDIVTGGATMDSTAVTVFATPRFLAIPR